MASATPILDKLRRLREYTIIVDLPPDFKMQGVMPFNVTVNDNKGIFVVLASNFKEAEKRVDDYIQRNATQ